MRTALSLIAACCCLLTACAHHTEDPFTITWRPADAAPRQFDAIIEHPQNPNGLRVMLLGGGSITDIHWTAPGSFTDPSTSDTTIFNINAETTRDAKRIADRLLEEGYTIWRGSSIYRGDPLHAENPAMADFQPFANTAEMAHTALDQFLSRDPEAAGNLVLLGHSLGAARSIIAGAEDDRVTAFVFLAGAYLSNNHRPSFACAEAIESSGLDADANNILSPAEAPALFPHSDLDADNLIRGWELAGITAARSAGWPDTGPTFITNQGGVRFESDWPSDQLVRANKPALAIYGGLDVQSVHGPVLAEKARQANAPINVIYFPDLGHQLSIEQDNQATHIDTRALDAIVTWLNQLNQ